MIFGLFKKDTGADIIFTGGKIHTMDPDMPQAEAVACKDGLVMAVGGSDWIDNEFKSKNTQVVDLQGATLLPGFIDVCGHPSLEAFGQACLILRDDMGIEEIRPALSSYISKNPERQSYLAYGLHPNLIPSSDKEKITAMLDEICDDKPIMLLDTGCLKIWLNSIALGEIKKAADEDASKSEDDKPPIISLPYIFNVLDPIDFSKLQEAAIDIAIQYCMKGYTTVFDCGAPDYPHAVYQDILVEMMQADLLKQRFIGSLLITSESDYGYVVQKLMQKKTNCMEIDNYITFNTLKLVMGKTPENEFNISPGTLKALSSQASERGFDVHIDATCKEAVICAFEAAALSKASGYKNMFTIAHSSELSQEERAELLSDGEVYETRPTCASSSVLTGMEGAKNVEEAIGRITSEAAAQLGVGDFYGTVQANKKADFAIFRKDPFECDLGEFLDMAASMTVMDGKIAYDETQDGRAKWLEIIAAREDDMSYEDDEDMYDYD